MIDATLSASSTALTQAAGAVANAAKQTPTLLARIGSAESMAVLNGVIIIVYVAGQTIAVAPYVAKGATSAYGWARSLVRRSVAKPALDASLPAI